MIGRAIFTCWTGRKRPASASFAGGDERVECAQRFFDRRDRIVAVNLVEVDVVGLEAAQAGVDRIHDVAARGADIVAPWPDARIHFGRDHHVFTGDLYILERLAEGLLAFALRIDIGGVEEVDAGIERIPDQVVGTGLVDGADRSKAAFTTVERHGSQAKRRDEQAGVAERFVLHAGAFAVASGVPRA